MATPPPPRQPENRAALQKLPCFWDSEEEVVHQDAEEEEDQDPVERVDVDDDQADVQQPAPHAVEVQSFQREAPVDKVPAPSRHRSTSTVI